MNFEFAKDIALLIVLIPVAIIMYKIKVKTRKKAFKNISDGFKKGYNEAQEKLNEK